MNSSHLVRAALLLCLVGGFLRPAAGEKYVFHHEHVLGTSLEIQVEADSSQVAAAAEERILAEIARQNAIFSSYDASSELSRWQLTQAEVVQVSPELFSIFQAAEEWRKQSRGAFNPATEAITKVWKEAATHNQLPARDKLKNAVRQVEEVHWRLDAANSTATHTSAAAISFNAIAKGYIVEAACKVGRGDGSQVRGLLINLGGDLRVSGDLVEQIAIADPFHDAVNAPPLANIFVREHAVATSGNYRRGFQIDGKWHSHIIDPRNGQPVTEIVSATVIAKSSVDADALATICNVLPTAESLALVESHAAACLLVSRDGEQHKSAGWEEFEQPQLYRFTAAVNDELARDELAQGPAQADDKKEEKVGLLELVVKIELPQPDRGGYRRPYVAIWLEDANDDAVRTGLLFMMTKGNGSNWHRNLNRWYKQDVLRRQNDKTDLIGTISSASRGPGEYKAVFDGKDDHGKPLKAGKYTLFIEAAREHGTYQIIRQPLELGDKPIDATSLKSNVEIKSASFEYRQPSAKTAGK
jgi:FAD:protein FMN transferase